MLNINNLLPLIQMMSQNKNQNIMDILNSFSSGQNNNNNMSDMLKNLNNPNFQNILKNMQGNNSNMNILSMLPILQNMFSQKPSAKEKGESKTDRKIINDVSKDKYLKPISKIANKDITYILNRYFS